MKKVTVYPQTKERFSSSPLSKAAKRKVAAYARVSTDFEEQQNSYELQIEYYSIYIRSRPDWEFAGIYTDEGISGTSTARREGFNTMISDALAGKIDLILTKSVSRFARNTVDSLTTIRNLKEHGVEVYFEKENIWTFNSKGELLITIMSSIAQEESRSMSENITWARRKRYAEGKSRVSFANFLGYDAGEDGTAIVNQEQAKLVLEIFRMYHRGLSTTMIADQLTKAGVPSPMGKDRWFDTVIFSILTNEKYRGDALLQKEFTVDFLTGKMKINEGEVPSYYVQNDHEPIIDPDEFELTYEILVSDAESKYKHQRFISGLIYCDLCGSRFMPYPVHSNDKYRHTRWHCRHRYAQKRCPAPSVSDTDLKTMLLSALREFLYSDPVYARDRQAILSMLSKEEKLQERISALEDKTEKAGLRMSSLTANSDEYRRMYKQNRKDTDRLFHLRTELKEHKTHLASISAAVERYIHGPELYDQRFIRTVLAKASVQTDKSIVFTFHNGFSCRIPKP